MPQLRPQAAKLKRKKKFFKENMAKVTGWPESVLLVDFLKTLCCAVFEEVAMLTVPCDKELRGGP